MRTIYLWKGYHSKELNELLQLSWNNNDLIILCPPYIECIDFFLPLLPSGKVQFIGNWSDVLISKVHTSIAEEYREIPVLGVFTTGTTRDTPKLVLYSKKNVSTTINGIMHFFEKSRVKSIFCYPQPFHVFGLILGYVTSLYGNIELIAEVGECTPFSHQRWFDIDRNKRKSMLTLGTPTHFKDLIYFLARRGLTPEPSYSCVAGGAPVDIALWKQLRGALFIESPTIGYGCTEASLGVTHMYPGQMPQEEGELGYLLPGVEAQVIAGKGLEISGESVCLAMIQNSRIEFPRSVLIEDNIFQRKDGIFVYRGRNQLSLNRGGEKYSLEQIEQFIKEVTLIDSVCVALADIRLGEELGVIIKISVQENVDEIKEKIYVGLKIKFGKHFSRDFFKVVEDFPVNQNAKLDRKLCKELFNE